MDIKFQALRGVDLFIAELIVSVGFHLFCHCGCGSNGSKLILKLSVT